MSTCSRRKNGARAKGEGMRRGGGGQSVTSPLPFAGMDRPTKKRTSDRTVRYIFCPVIKKNWGVDLKAGKVFIDEEELNSQKMYRSKSFVVSSDSQNSFKINPALELSTKTC